MSHTGASNSPSQIQLIPPDAKQASGILLGVLSLTAQTSTGINLDYAVTNTTDHELIIHFNSGMAADLRLTGPSGKLIWAFSREMMFTQALRQQLLAAKGTLRYSFKVPAKALTDCKNPCQLEVLFLGTNNQGQPFITPHKQQLKWLASS